MKKKIMCLVMIALMVLCAPLNVFAEDLVGSKEWEVSFDGKNIDSNFKQSEVAEDVLNMLPGDSITLTVNLKDVSGGKSDWYIKNDIRKTLEDSSESAGGGAYTYILKYHDQDGKETVLYSSEVVGGEVQDGGNEGLREVESGLDTYIYLGRLNNGEKGYITLYVKLDGETQGNDYQNTLAELQMNFAVEKVSASSGNLSQSVKTGDNANIMLFSTATLISGLALMIVVVVMMKKNRYKKGE